MMDSSDAQMEYDLGGFAPVLALEERRREALPDLPPSDLINVALQKYRCALAPCLPVSKACVHLFPYILASCALLKSQLTVHCTQEWRTLMPSPSYSPCLCPETFYCRACP